MEGPNGGVAFNTLNTEEAGSHERYRSRPRHTFWWIIHNCVAHPMIGVAPVKVCFDFHDFTSRKINEKRKP